MTRREPNSAEVMARLHDSTGLSEAFAEVHAALYRDWWIDSMRVKTDRYNAVYDANPRWHVSAAGIADPVGGEEEAEGSTLPEALRNLAAVLRGRPAPLYDTRAPDTFDAMDALWGKNERGITTKEAVAILDERSPMWRAPGSVVDVEVE